MQPAPFPIRITIPDAVVTILRRLETAGYETWCVGGAIRDQFSGRRGTRTSISPPRRRPTRCCVSSPRNVPVGLAHGTVGVIGSDRNLHEVTTFRRDVRTDGRHAVVEFGVSLDDDLARRDFTINAIAYHPDRHEWRDPFNGRGDIERRFLRAVGDAVLRFREDRLRILRALRFAARFDLAVDPATWTAAVAAGGRHRTPLGRAGPRGMGEGHPDQPVDRRTRRPGARAGVAPVWLPGTRLPASLDERSVGRRPARPGPRDGVRCRPVRASVAPPQGIERRTSAGPRSIDRGPAAPERDDDADVRRWMAAVGDGMTDLVTIARWRDGGSTPWVDAVDRILARGDATSRGQLALSGDDLIAAGVPRGPAVGAMLGRLLDAVLDDPTLNSRDRLLQLARTVPLP